MMVRTSEERNSSAAERLLGSDWLFSFGRGEILQMPLGSQEDAEEHDFFQITCLMHYCQDIVTVL